MLTLGGDTMKLTRLYGILILLLVLYKNTNASSASLFFYGDKIVLPNCEKFDISFNSSLSDSSIEIFYARAERSDYQQHIQQIINYKEENQLDDWLYYQLVRKLADALAPKTENYNRYTLYKWFIMLKSGYDVSLSVSDSQLLFYVQSDENVYSMPYFMRDEKKFVCLNYHDFGSIDFDKHSQQEVYVQESGVRKAFTYKINNIPDFKNYTHIEKQIHFEFDKSVHQLTLSVSKATSEIFKNYPLVDFETYFNIPLSDDLKNKLLPDLKKQMLHFNQKEGIAFLLAFTQNAFAYKNDQEHYGKEKRLAPEQTIISDFSDCDDRVSLFYYLVKEIYNLPIIAILHPTHISVGVKLDKPSGKTIEYKGEKYTYCDPTPQAQSLSVGEILKKYRKDSFEIVFQYTPKH